MRREYKDFLLFFLQESFFHPSSTSPSQRRESTPLLEKMRADITLNQAKILAALEKKEEKKRAVPPKDQPPMIKYMTTQVSAVIHAVIHQQHM